VRHPFKPFGDAIGYERSFVEAPRSIGFDLVRF
jgi:hypothetical protein